MTTGAGQTPGTLLGVTSLPLSEGCPLLAVSGSSRGWASSRVVKSHLGSPDVVCHCGGTGDRGLFAPQSSCPVSSWRHVSHLPYTSTGLLRARSGKYLQNSLCPAGRGEQTPTPVNLRRRWTHWGMLMHQQLTS